MKKIILLFTATFFLFSCGQSVSEKHADEVMRENIKMAVIKANRLVDIYNNWVELQNQADPQSQLEPLDLKIDTTVYFFNINQAHGSKLKGIEQEVKNISSEIIDSTSKYLF